MFWNSHIRIFALVAALAALPATTAQAATIRINWTGAVESLTTFGDPGAPTLASRFAAGDVVTGRVQFDNAVFTSFTDVLPTLRSYAGAPFSIRATVDGARYRAQSDTIRVANNDNAGSPANPLRDGITFNAEPVVSGRSVGGLAPRRLQLSLGSFDTSILTALDLPGVAQINALGATQTFNGAINFLSFANGETVRYSLSGVTAKKVTVRPRLSSAIASLASAPVPPAPVPLPPAALLLAGGLAALGLLRRRRA